MSIFKTTSNLDLYRVYILMIIVIFPLWSFANQYFITPTPEYHDTYLLRLFFVSPGIIFYFLSYKSSFIQRNIHWCFLFVCIGMNMGHGLLVSMSRFDSTLVSGQILVMLLISVHLESIKHFLIFNILALLVVFYPSVGETVVQREIYFLELFTVSLVTFAVLLQKLRLVKKVISSQKSLEEEKVRSFNAQRLSSLGQMAGGIAHEINNPLYIMNLYVEQMGKYAQDNQMFQELAIKHKSTSNRISKIISGLSTISRDAATDPLTKLLSEELIDDVINLTLMRFDKYRIKFIQNIKSGIPLRGRIVELQQVIINLLNNACDAIAELDLRVIELNIFKENKNFILEVKDSGVGVDKSQVLSIFDPFFTTKGIGKGTGLGLSISKSIVEEHGGSIYVDPVERNKFVMRLPIDEV